jgi:hypothetical protein
VISATDATGVIILFIVFGGAADVAPLLTPRPRSRNRKSLPNGRFSPGIPTRRSRQPSRCDGRTGDYASPRMARGRSKCHTVTIVVYVRGRLLDSSPQPLRCRPLDQESLRS